jgi:hypothetical protein
MLRDYEKEREERVKALTGHRYIGTSWNNRAIPRRGYIDVRTPAAHVLRVWRHGPMSLFCPCGDIRAQDAMFLLTNEWACGECMAIVAYVRRRRSMDLTLYHADLSRAERDQLDTPMSKIGMATRARERDQLGSAIRVMLEEQGYHKPLADRYKGRFQGRMSRLIMKDVELSAWTVTPYMANGSELACDVSTHARAFRKTSKYLYLRLPRRLMFQPDDRLLRGGRFIGGIETETEQTMTAWAIKVGSPLKATGWALAQFERNESGDWYFRHWKRTKGGK